MNWKWPLTLDKGSQEIKGFAQFHWNFDPRYYNVFFLNTDTKGSPGSVPNSGDLYTCGITFATIILFREVGFNFLHCIFSFPLNIYAFHYSSTCLLFCICFNLYSWSLRVARMGWDSLTFQRKMVMMIYIGLFLILHVFALKKEDFSMTQGKWDVIIMKWFASVKIILYSSFLICECQWIRTFF